MAVNAFLAAGMSPDVKDESRKETALIAAASRGDVPIAKTLIDGGANVNATSPTGANALIRALENKHEEVSTLLLAQPKLDLNTQRADGTTVLMIYAAREKEPQVAQLLERGVNVNLQDGEGDTALHRASQSGNLRIVQMLLDKSANPNIQNQVGGTPLMWAGAFGHHEVAKALLARGANPRLKDEDGMTASAWATKNYQTDLASVLREAEKNGDSK